MQEEEGKFHKVLLANKADHGVASSGVASSGVASSGVAMLLLGY